MNKHVKTMTLSILAGILIGLGGFVNLYCNFKYDNPIAGALFFTVGLVFVCYLGCNLFTGKVGYVFENKLEYSANILLMILGNFLGAGLVGLIFMYVNDLNAVQLMKFINSKISTYESTFTIGKLFLKSVLAGVFVFLAVEGFKKVENQVAKILLIFLSIGTMVLIGAEHSVANGFYFVSCARLILTENSYFVFPSLVTAIFGNILGSLFMWFLFNLGSKISLKKEK